MDIQPTDPAERTLGGIDFFLLWAGVAISLAEIWAGGLLAPMGWGLGFLAIILGHLIGNTFMALGGVIGSQHGIMSMVSVRPSFGIRGSNLAAVLNIIQLMCWASIMLIIGGRAGALLGRPLGGLFASNNFWIVSIGLGTLLWALSTGRSIWKHMQASAVTGLLLVLLVMSWLTFEEVGGLARAATTEKMPFMFGLDLVIAMPISWMPLVADYSRFSKRTNTAFWNTWGGYFLVSSWMYLLGLTATLVSGSTEPHTQILQLMGRIGLTVPALLMVVFSTITSDFPDVYSATCSVLNISRRVGAKTAMWLAGIFSILVALVFPMERYESFLFFIGAMFVPLFGVVLTDYFIIRKGRLKLQEVYREGGDFWYFRGFNPVALFSWVIGFATYEVIETSRASVGASLPSLLVAGLVYYLLTSIRTNPPKPQRSYSTGGADNSRRSRESRSRTSGRAPAAGSR